MDHRGIDFFFSCSNRFQVGFFFLVTLIQDCNGVVFMRVNNIVIIL